VALPTKLPNLFRAEYELIEVFKKYIPETSRAKSNIDAVSKLFKRLNDSNRARMAEIEKLREDLKKQE